MTLNHPDNFHNVTLHLNYYWMLVIVNWYRCIELYFRWTKPSYILVMHY